MNASMTDLRLLGAGDSATCCTCVWTHSYVYPSLCCRSITACRCLSSSRTISPAHIQTHTMLVFTLQYIVYISVLIQLQCITVHSFLTFSQIIPDKFSLQFYAFISVSIFYYIYSTECTIKLIFTNENDPRFRLKQIIQHPQVSKTTPPCKTFINEH